MRFIDPDGMITGEAQKQEDYSTGDYQYSDGYSNSNASGITGAVSINGALTSSGGGEVWAGPGDKDKGKKKGDSDVAKSQRFRGADWVNSEGIDPRKELFISEDTYNNVSKYDEAVTLGISIAGIVEAPYKLVLSGAKLLSSMKAWVKGGLQLERSVFKTMGYTYNAFGEVTVPIKNVELLNKLNTSSNENWVKVYQAGIQDGTKMEIHFFRNNNPGQVFDVKTKYNYWYQKAFRNL